MPLNLANYQKKATESVKAFWGNRDAARQKQIEAGKVDAGSRGAVTAGNFAPPRQSSHPRNPPSKQASFVMSAR
jgi:hypothetical protein